MIKKLARSVREYKLSSILTPIFVALEVVLECILPFIMAELIDQIYGSTMNKILLYGFILVLMAAFSLIFGALSGKYCATASSGFAKNLRHDLYGKVQGFSFSNIDRFSSASLVTRLTTDVTNVQNAYMMIIRIAIRCPLMLVFSLCMTLVINVKMSLILLCIIPILGIGLFVVIKIVYPIFNKVFKKYDNMNNSVQENVKAMRVVKAYVREDYEQEKFENVSNEVRKDFLKAERILALCNPLVMFCMYTITLLMAVIGAFLIINSFGGITAEGVYMWGELSTGELASLITYSTQILSSLVMLSMVLVMITMSSASAKRIVEVLDEESDIVNPAEPITEVKNGDITFENVDFKYRADSQKYALSGINLDIKSGETVGIIGGTGSSKTTLIQLISRLYDVTNGTVKVGDEDVKNYDLETLRDAVSVVLQKNVLFSGTIKENLRWGDKNATDEEMIAACKAAQADDFIRSFPDGYDTYIEQGGSNVSGGQKQRLCIARALLKKPKVLILDDSTSAVDTKTDALIRKAFKEDIPHITKLIIAQRIASVQDADKIVVMNNGTIDAVGTHDELLASNEIYKEVYMSQNKVGDVDET